MESEFRERKPAGMGRGRAVVLKLAAKQIDRYWTNASVRWAMSRACNHPSPVPARCLPPTHCAWARASRKTP